MVKHRNSFNPAISLVIPAYNEEKFIGKTLESVLRQDFKDFELIVVDNNSTDKTAEIAKKYGAKVVFATVHRVGFVRQAGFDAAKGKIIATTDADTILPEKWLSRIASEFRKNRKMVLFGGPFSFYSGSLLTKIVAAHFSPLIWRIDRVLTGMWTIAGVNLAVRQDAFKMVNGFDTDLTVGEDAEICRRLGKIGEVGFSFDHRVFTSGRRFKNGLAIGFLFYLPHYLSKILFKKYIATPFPPVRSEISFWRKYNYFPLLALAVIIFIFFSFNNFRVSYGKEIADFKQKVVELVEEKIIDNLSVSPSPK